MNPDLKPRRAAEGRKGEGERGGLGAQAGYEPSHFPLFCTVLDRQYRPGYSSAPARSHLLGLHTDVHGNQSLDLKHQIDSRRYCEALRPFPPNHTPFPPNFDAFPTPGRRVKPPVFQTLCIYICTLNPFNGEQLKIRMEHLKKDLEGRRKGAKSAGKEFEKLQVAIPSHPHLRVTSRTELCLRYSVAHTHRTAPLGKRTHTPHPRGRHVRGQRVRQISGQPTSSHLADTPTPSLTYCAPP